MDAPDLFAAKPDREVDVRGQVCPYPLIETKNSLKDMRPGEILEVRTDAEMSAMETLPALCKALGHPIQVEPDGPGWRVRIRKSGA